MCLVSSVHSFAALSSIDAPSSAWNSVSYKSVADDPTDSNGAQHEELVGTALVPFFFTAFDDNSTPSNKTDGTMYFRTRHADADNKGNFSSNLFIGIDANKDFVLDAFVGVNSSGNSNDIFIASPDFSASNDSVNDSKIDRGTETSVTINPGVNYNWRKLTAADFSDPTDSLDLDGAQDGSEDDYYLSFSVNFNTLSSVLSTNTGTTVDEDTALRFVVGTSTQNNSFNKDLGGLNGSGDFGTAFSLLPNGGPVSEQFSATGTPILVPEPTSSMLLASGLLLACGIRRKK
ncbi:PEP-CTERM sorting domain-containing protein [Rubritalea tangerina]|uniref:PEP-CTERM sorting domain-containing protein n=1 Tax=Rubritalea tangerina TaxID=430798 RepID=UPI0036243D5C